MKVFAATDQLIFLLAKRRENGTGIPPQFLEFVLQIYLFFAFDPFLHPNKNNW